MAFDIAALHAATDNLALTVRTIEATAVTLEADRAALVVRVQAWGDADWEAGPLAALSVQYAEIVALRNKVKATAKALCDQALTAVSMSLSDWYDSLRAMGDRLPPEFGQLVRANAGQILPLYVWPPFETQMAEVVFPGAALNQTIETAPIDTKQYAGANMKLKVKTATILTSVAADLAVVVNGYQYNGDPFHGTATIPKGSIVGFEVAVVTGYTDVFCREITTIVCTVAGGAWTQGEFDALTDDDRAPAA